MKRNLIADCIASEKSIYLEKRLTEIISQEERRNLCNRAARIARHFGIKAKAEQGDTGRRDVICHIEMNGHKDRLLIGIFYPDNHVGVLGPTTKTHSRGWMPVTKDLRTLPTVLKSELTRYAEETASINRLYKKNI